MADVTVYLNGGPCDGTDKNLTQSQYDSHVTTCKSTVYKYDAALTKNFELPVFSSSDSAGVAAGTGGDLKAPRAHSGWAAIRHSLNVNMVHRIDGAEQLTLSALRSLSHSRKVRL